MTKWIPVIVSVGGVVVTALSPTIQHFWASHALASTTILSTWGVVKYLLPSPISQQ